MKQKIVFAIIMILSVSLFPQNIKKMQKEADEQFSYGNYHLAKPLYNAIYEQDTANKNIAYKLGVCLFKVSRNKLEAIPYFEKSTEVSPDAYYYLGILYRLNGELSKSEQAFLKYKNEHREKSFTYQQIEYQLNKTYTARKLLKDRNLAKVILLDKNINSSYPDYAPFILPIEGTMFFTSRRPGSSNNNKDPLGLYYEDIYYSERVNKKWLPAKNVGAPINTPYHDACVGFSKDGKFMYIYRNDAYTGGDIYVSERIDKKTWTNPVKFTESVNRKESVESSITITQDERTIYFSSNMAGGYGGKDIYRIVKLPNGRWSLPLNMGASINTPYDEDAPFITASGDVMYFSSKGHKNMGGYDIFVSRKNDSGEWTEPVNLGVPINSVADDIFFVTNPEQTKGYFSSNRKGGVGDMDIYMVKMSDLNKKPIILKGSVTTYQPSYQTLKAVITIIDIQTKEIQGIYRTTKDGKFILALLPNRKYKMIVEAQGYHSATADVDLTNGIRDIDLFKNVVLEAK